MQLTLLPHRYAVCRLDPDAAIPPTLFDGEFWSVTRTEEELSLIVLESIAPPESRIEGGWRVLKVAGPLDFSLTGILASLTAPLAEANISLFALSTYDTDYLLLKEETLSDAMAVLTAAGHRIT